MGKNMLSVLKSISLFNGLYRFLIQEETTMDVKAEKDVAVRKFNRLRKFKWLFEAMAVLFVLAQSSAYWLPIAAEIFRETVAIFRSHLFVFALFNSIILAIYALSAVLPRPSNDAASSEKTELYEVIATDNRIIPDEEESPPPPESDIPDNVAEEPKVSDCTDGSEITDKALVVSDSPHFYHHQRSRSPSFQMKTRIGEESQRDFRRSYTDIRRKLTPCGGEGLEAVKSSVVNMMSVEELNRRIEDFIATQKWIQQEECKEERKVERFNMALTTTVCQ